MRLSHKSSIMFYAFIFGMFLATLFAPLAGFAQKKTLPRQHPIYKTIDDEQNRLHWDYWGGRGTCTFGDAH